MFMKLLKKELALCLHPMAWLMPLLTGLIMIPNYPYAVSFFYVTLGLFFVSMNARENHDVVFTLTLPVAKKDAVTGRFALAALVELFSLVLTLGVIALHNAVLGEPNAVGMDANLALPGLGFLVYGAFNLVFFPAHYKDVSRVGVPFLAASAVTFVLILAEIAAGYALPFWRDVLDTPDPAHPGAKLAFTAACAVLYALATLLALRRSQERFVKQDIR